MRIACLLVLCASSLAHTAPLDLFFGTIKVGDVGKVPTPAEPPIAGPAIDLVLYKIESVHEKEGFIVVTAQHWQTRVVKPASFVVRGPTKDKADGQRFIPKDLWKVVGTQKVDGRTLFVLEQVAEKPEEKALRVKKEQFIPLANERARFEKANGPKNKSVNAKKWQADYDARIKRIADALGISESAAKIILEEGDKAKWPRE